MSTGFNRSINSSQHVLLANLLFGNCAENILVEVFYNNMNEVFSHKIGWLVVLV